jgi:hypothetical protein
VASCDEYNICYFQIACLGSILLSCCSLRPSSSWCPGGDNKHASQLIFLCLSVLCVAGFQYELLQKVDSRGPSATPAVFLKRSHCLHCLMDMEILNQLSAKRYASAAILAARWMLDVARSMAAWCVKIYTSSCTVLLSKQCFSMVVLKLVASLVLLELPSDHGDTPQEAPSDLYHKPEWSTA